MARLLYTIPDIILGKRICEILVEIALLATLVNLHKTNCNVTVLKELLEKSVFSARPCTYWTISCFLSLTLATTNI